jgi:hypothetical protein
MSEDNRSVTARDITGSSVVTGDHNTVTTSMKQVPLPPADQVDVKAELAALREALAALQKVPDRGKLDRAIEDAVDETGKPKPDKEEVGGALERAVKGGRRFHRQRRKAAASPDRTRLLARTSRARPALDGWSILVRASSPFPIISRFRKINSRFRLTGIGVQEIDQKRYY